MDRQTSKEWQLLEKVALASVVEQRRTRRWGIFFKSLTFIYLFAIIGLFSAGGDKVKGIDVRAKDSHTAVVKMHGLIMDEEAASAGVLIAGLRKAFEAPKSKAVILAINSPGGSPVHAGYVYDEIIRLRALHPDKKVYAVISDLGASAAYYIAAAADEIYADKASLVGSIGVISASFGFTEAMQKLGIERRIITAGENKAFMDPYQPLKDEDKAFWQQSLQLIHQQFIDRVKEGRGDRLQESEGLYTGLIWSGEQAMDMGLIDGLGSASFVARDVIGAQELVDYSVHPDPVTAFMRRFGIMASQAIFSQWNKPQLY